MNGQKQCECDNCKRSRAFKKHLENVTTSESKKWFEDLFNYLYEIEEEIECQEIYLKNLKTLYPRIWKETTTIKPLFKDDAEYPEKQI